MTRARVAITTRSEVRLGSIVEKGFSGVAPIVRTMKGFLELLPERNGDSPSAPNRNSILSAHHIISHKIDFFDSIGQNAASK
jgi:hypothetical protein